MDYNIVDHEDDNGIRALENSEFCGSEDVVVAESQFSSFDMVIEFQRKKHCVEEVKTKYTVPRMVSPRKLEAYASKVYTQTIFFEFQKELNKALHFCGLVDIDSVAGKIILTITQNNKDSEVKATFKVLFIIQPF
ncbi:hypothetical protein L6452_19139 [Arctium lappa]|uniref:Uncharacterized protein n=1 Tax=Arctium lappa TaxID=4217 RepID=A0ACB9B8J8_ARCLA|nr:hypothetical protein L6452_19139 [Arctium lappa]